MLAWVWTPGRSKSGRLEPLRVIRNTVSLSAARPHEHRDGEERPHRVFQLGVVQEVVDGNASPGCKGLGDLLGEPFARGRIEVVIHT